MPLYMGIDGGGSSLRVAVVKDDLTIIARGDYPSANPSVIGHDAAASLIQSAMRDVLAAGGLKAADVDAVGVGIAGASVAHHRPWLFKTVSKIIPPDRIIPSSDVEIALVGGRGERQGILLLAGTGSVAYGINTVGETVQVGGWGYLVGDEGSGYWLGKAALQEITHAADGRSASGLLTQTILVELGLSRPVDLIDWLYALPTPRTRDIAALAPLVLEAADMGDPAAQLILDEGADKLVQMYIACRSRLGIETNSPAFAGRLLEKPNPLSLRVCQRMNLSHIPPTLYPPVIGAALLAKFAAEA